METLSTDYTGELSRVVGRELADRQARRGQTKGMLLQVLRDVPDRDVRCEMFERGVDPAETSAALRDLEHEGLAEIADYRYRLTAP